ncbi:MAG: hypothetical protein KKE20_01925 [Nanoarchaeota archaeon]|nr:hypothetical protein [Nanoarchaeota archaeon]
MASGIISGEELQGLIRDLQLFTSVYSKGKRPDRSEEEHTREVLRKVLPDDSVLGDVRVNGTSPTEMLYRFKSAYFGYAKARNTSKSRNEFRGSLPPLNSEKKIRVIDLSEPINPADLEDTCRRLSEDYPVSIHSFNDTGKQRKALVFSFDPKYEADREVNEIIQYVICQGISTLLLEGRGPEYQASENDFDFLKGAVSLGASIKYDDESGAAIIQRMAEKEYRELRQKIDTAVEETPDRQQAIAEMTQKAGSLIETIKNYSKMRAENGFVPMIVSELSQERSPCQIISPRNVIALTETMVKEGVPFYAINYDKR